MSRGSAAVAAALAVLGALASPATAGDSAEPVQIFYERGPGAAACQARYELLAAVREHLGYDPVAPDAATAVYVTVQARSRGPERRLVARIEVRDADERVVGVRVIDSPSTDCEELGSAVALAVTIAIDPLHDVRAPRGALALAPPQAPRERLVGIPLTVAPPPRRAPRVNTPAAPRRPAEARAPIALAATLGFGANFGAGPETTGQLAFGVDGRRGAASLGLALRIDSTATEAMADGARIETRVVAAELAPCFHRGWLAACGVATAGVLHGQGAEIADPRASHAAFATAGGRLAVELPVAPRLGVRLRGDVTAALTRIAVGLDGRTVWESPPVTGAVGLDAVARFW